jgi:hypothetical protein
MGPLGRVNKVVRMLPLCRFAYALSVCCSPRSADVVPARLHTCTLRLSYWAYAFCVSKLFARTFFRTRPPSWELASEQFAILASRDGVP